MTPDRLLIQIRNGIYLLCLLTVLTFIVVAVISNHQTNRSISEMKSVSMEASTEQALLNELNDLLETNQLDALISRCEKLIKDRPLSPTGHYHLGLAKYHSGDLVGSRASLEETLRIDPSWKAAVEPFLENL